MTDEKDDDVKDVDHGEELEVTKRDREAAEGDQTPAQMRDVDPDAIPDPAEAGRGYVVSGIDPAHVQQPDTEDNAPKGTLPGV